MCDCGGYSVNEQLNNRKGAKQVSYIDNKWVMDNLNRKLLVQGPIYDIYNDIIGYITKNEDGNTVRIFPHNIREILD